MHSADFISQSTSFSTNVSDLIKGLQGHSKVFTDKFNEGSLKTAEGANELLLSDLKLLNTTLEKAEVFKKSLDEKVKSKEKLNFFKTQKNLDGVKSAGDKLASSLKSGREAAVNYEGQSKTFRVQLATIEKGVKLEAELLPKVRKALNDLRGSLLKCIDSSRNYEAALQATEKKFTDYADLGELKTAVDEVARTSRALEIHLDLTRQKRTEVANFLEQGKAAVTPKALAELKTAGEELTKLDKGLNEVGLAHPTKKIEQAPGLYRAKLGMRQRLHENEAALTKELAEKTEQSVDARNELDAYVHDLEDLVDGFKKTAAKGDAAQTTQARTRAQQTLAATVKSLVATGSARSALANSIKQGEKMVLQESRQALTAAAKEVPMNKSSFDVANKLAIQTSTTLKA